VLAGVAPAGPLHPGLTVARGEPLAPAGRAGGGWDWSASDRLVGDTAGWPELELALTGAGDPARLASWAEALAERYDGDGRDDLPDLERPVRRFRVEAGVLGPVAEALRRAHPEGRVVAAAWAPADLEDDLPVPDTVRERLDAAPDLAAALAGLESLGAACDSWDEAVLVVERGVTGIGRGLTRLREALEAGGCGSRRLLVEATSLPDLAPGWPEEGTAPQFVPFLPWLQGAALLESLGDGAAPDHGDVETWVRAQQAAEVVKRWVVAAGEGATGILLRAAADSPGGGSLSFLGLLDASGEPRPALVAWGLLLEELSGWSSVERLPLVPDGEPGAARHSDVRVYRFETPRGPRWVGWYDRVTETVARVNPVPVGHGPGEDWPTRYVDVPVGSGEVSVLLLPTTSVRPFEWERRPAPGGVYRTVLGTEPLVLANPG